MIARLAVALLLVLLLAPGVAVRAEAPVLVTIDLQHRNAEELIPLLRPVAGDLTLSGQGAILIVRGPQARIDELMTAVQALDVPQRTLLVSLRQGSIDEVDAGGSGVSIAGSGSGRVTVEHYGTRGRDDTVQTVRVLDGREAFVTLGRSMPVPERIGIATGPRGGVAAGVDMGYRDASTGFLVRPHVRGDTVTVEVTPRSVRAAGDGSFDTASLSTTLSGRLGQWLLIGGSAEARRAERDAVVHSTRARSGSERVWLLKVEPAP